VIELDAAGDVGEAFRACSRLLRRLRPPLRRPASSSRMSISSHASASASGPSTVALSTSSRTPSHLRRSENSAAVDLKVHSTAREIGRSPCLMDRRRLRPLNLPYTARIDARVRPGPPRALAPQLRPFVLVQHMTCTAQVRRKSCLLPGPVSSVQRVGTRVLTLISSP